MNDETPEPDRLIEKLVEHLRVARQYYKDYPDEVNVKGFDYCEKCHASIPKGTHCVLWVMECPFDLGSKDGSPSDETLICCMRCLEELRFGEDIHRQLKEEFDDYDDSDR